MDTSLEIKNLSINLTIHEKPYPVLDACDLFLEKGKTVGVVGESGSGKTILSLSILGLLPKNALISKDSEILFHKKNLIELQKEQLFKIRGKKISMIFQEPLTSLDPLMSIGDQIAEKMMIHDLLSQSQARSKAIELLDFVKIPNPKEKYDHFPFEYSGGMRQRVMIAMALACEPELLIADEPTTALDVTIQSQIIALLNNLQKVTNLTILLVTHDLGVVSEMCDYVAVLYKGRIVEQGPIQTVLKAPKHPYTQGLIAATPSPLAQRKLAPIEGHAPSILETIPGCSFSTRCPNVTDECRNKIPPIKTIAKNHQVACLKVN